MSTSPAENPGRDARRQAVAGLLILFAAAGLLLSANIGGYELWTVDEAQNAQAAREMLQGAQALAPTVNGLPAPDMPPLPAWSVFLASRVPGEVTEWSARLPSALAAFGTLLLTFLLALDLFGRRTAIWSVIVLATSAGFWWQARTADGGALLTLAVTAMFFGLWRWDAVRRRRWLVVAYGALAASLLIQGPLALVYPAAFFVVFYRGEPASRKQSRWPAGLAAALLPALVWHGAAHLQAEGAGWETFLLGLWENSIGRVFLGHGTPGPPWHYLATLPVAWFPWIAFLPWILAHAWQERGANRMMFFLLCWAVPAFLVFSIVRDKQLAYTIPLHPALAIIAARGIVYFDRTATAQWRSRVAWAWGLAAATIGLAALALAWLPMALPGRADAAERPWLLSTMAVAVFALGAYAALRGRRRRADLVHRVVAGQAALILFMAALAVVPEINRRHSVRDLTAPVRMLADAGDRVTVYAGGAVEPVLVFYSRRPQIPVLPRLVVVADEAEELGLLDDASTEALAAFVRRFAVDDPVFLFVAGDDWRRIVPIAEGLPTYHVLRQKATGRREWLLVANPAAEDLYRRRKGGAGMLSRHPELPPTALGTQPNT